jgi:hypothetical protein
VITTLMASPLFERLVGTGKHQPIPEPNTGSPRSFEDTLLAEHSRSGAEGNG